MIRGRLRVWLFIILAMVQLTVLLSMAWRWEDTLQRGQQYRFATAPVDPYDMLRGRYVALGFKVNSGPLASGAVLNPNQTAYAAISVGADGCAVFSSVSDMRPEKGCYLIVKVRYIKNNNVYVSIPFNRYYMTENLAPAAEMAYRKRAGKDGVAVVRIKDGYGVVEQLYIGEKTIYEYLLNEK